MPRPNDEDCVAKSLYFVDEAIYPGHPRFKTLSRNIRMRRGSKVSIDIPGDFDLSGIFHVKLLNFMIFRSF